MSEEAWLLHGALPSAPAHYRIAGLTFAASRTIAALEAFAARPPAVATAPAPKPFPPIPGISGRGLLGGRQRCVTATAEGGYCRLAIDGELAFVLTPRELRWRCTGEPGRLLLEALVGPALLLFLALRGRFALHASAAARRHRGAWLFLGDSGVGKSTLAEAARRAPEWTPLADDVVVLSGAGAPRARPWFPQLRLGPRAQYGGSGAPDSVPLAGFCLLARLRAGTRPTLTCLGPREAAVGLLRQGVSARLMPAPLLAAQLALIAAATAAVPAWRLGVPRSLGTLPAVYDLLAGVAPEQSGQPI